MKINKVDFNFCILISILILMGCQNSNNQDKPIFSKSISKKIDKENKIKLFLDYWSGMSSSEFYTVTDMLKKKGIVEWDGNDIRYNLGDKKLKIDLYYPNYDYISADKPRIDKNEIAKGINLWWFDTDSYEIFRKKYNLPNCKLVKNVKFFIEDNPLYLNSSADEYICGKNRREIEINEITAFIKSGFEDKLKYPPYSDDNLRVSVHDEILIEKDSIVIVLKDIKDVDDNQTLDGHYIDKKTSFIYLNNDKNKSKRRIVKQYDYSQLRATYLPKNWYYQNKKEIDDKYKKTELESLETDKKNSERKSKVSSEI